MENLNREKKLNEWKIEGEVIFIKKLIETDFSDILRIKIQANRRNSLTYMSCEFPCLIPTTCKIDNINLFDYIECSGHFETWINSQWKNKIKFVVDDIKIKKKHNNNDIE